MAVKPKIQYVDQFYVYGSEARQLEEKRQPRTILPLAKLEQIEKIYIDPVALVGIAVAIFMLITMAIGVAQLRDDWTAYERMSNYVSELKRDNAEMEAAFRESYDLDDIQSKAIGLGMIPMQDAVAITVRVKVPQRAPEPTYWDHVRWFWSGLFE